MAPKINLTVLDEAFSNSNVAEGLKSEAPDYFEAARSFWHAPFSARHLSPRMKELIYFAMHGSSSALHTQVMERHIHRVLAAGGTVGDMLDVMITIVGVANHAVYAAVPILDEEWAKTGKTADVADDDDPRLVAAKERFVAIRKFWNPERESIARSMPDYYAALTDVSIATWARGSLTRKERELVCIGIDCNLTHSYPPGLRIHIRNAISEGANREEILEVFALAGIMGLEGYTLTGEILFRAPPEKPAGQMGAEGTI